MSVVYTHKMTAEEKKAYRLKQYFKTTFFAKVMEMVTIHGMKQRIMRKYEELADYLFEDLEANEETIELSIKTLKDIFYDPKNVHTSGDSVLLFNNIIDSMNKRYPKFIGISYAKELKKDVKSYHDEIMIEMMEDQKRRRDLKDIEEPEDSADDWPEGNLDQQIWSD